VDAALPLFARPEFRDLTGPALRPGGAALTERGLDVCGLARGARVADLGCGRGASLSLLEARGFSTLGLDPSAELLAEARTSVPLLRGRGEALPLAGESLDAALCECVLSLSPAPDAFLAETARVLAPGGRLLLSDLYLRSPGGPAESQAAGCASGAVSRCLLEERLMRAGFGILLFEDHSRSLAELAGRLIFAGFPQEALGLGCGSGARPGYCLCVAQKRKERA